MPWRSWIGRIAFALILVGAFQPFYWRMYAVNRKGYGEWLTELPYSRTPGLRTFIAGVRERTGRGSRIAIATPATSWRGGYEYAFVRATYLLAGRTTIPLIGEDDRPHPENLESAEYLACFQCEPALPAYKAVWRTPDGVLARRTF